MSLRLRVFYRRLSKDRQRKSAYHIQFESCEAISAGTCAIAAYNQTLVDQLLEVDGEEEFSIYIAPVGKVPRQP